MKLPAVAISLLTDFGDGGSYIGQLKAVLSSRAPTAQLIDISHVIPRHDVTTGALALSDAAPYFPDMTVHLAVVDPGVGSSRKRIAIESAVIDPQSGLNKTAFFVGPDNGLLTLAAKKESREKVVEISNLELIRAQRISKCFEGRDIFAPAAAYLSNGGAISLLGQEGIEIVELKLPSPRINENGELRGEIISIDSFGNCQSNFHLDLCSIEEARVDGISGSLKIVSSFSELAVGGLGLLLGSSGRLELVVNKDSAAERFGIKLGTGIFLRVRGAR